MKISFKKSIMFMMILLALTVSALGATPALADDGVTPPADAPAVEEPVADAPVTEESVADEPASEEPVADAPIVEQPAAEEPVAEDATVAEILEAAPKGTEVVVLDESGEALPLASTEAAEALASGDPYFWDGTQYVGYTTTTCPAIVDDCNVVASAPIQAAVNAFAASSSATGEIFVAAGTYTENVGIDGGFGNLANLSGLIGAGSDSTTINGYLDATGFNNPFTLSGFSFTNEVYIESSSDVFVDDVVVTESSDIGLIVNADGDISVWNSAFNDNRFHGLWASSDSGNVMLDGVTATGNGNFGAYVYSGGDISIWDSAFNDNVMLGLYAYSDSGNVMLDGVTASGNDENGALVVADGDISIFDSAFNNNNYDGLFTRSYSGNVLLDGVTASGNGDRGAYLEADKLMVEVFCSDFSDNDLGLRGGKSGPDLYLNGVTFSGNASDDYTNSGNVWVNDHDCGHSVNTPKTQAPADDGTDKKEQTPAPLYIVVEQVQGQLPAALGEGFKFGSALKVELTNEGKDVTDLAMTLSFPIPDGMKDASLVVMFWNGSAWVEVSGGSVVNGFYIITVNQPGDYVLVSK